MLEVAPMRREPTTAREAKCTCARVTEREKEATNITREPVDKSRT
jgi:hypothetical protein